MRSTEVRALTFAAVVALGACGDSTEPEMDPLTEAEAAEIAAFLMGQSFGATGMPVSFQEMARMEPGSPPVALARVDFDETVTEVVQFPLGGSVQVTAAVEGFADDETGEFQMDAIQTQVYEGCTGRGEAEEFTFTLDSAPDVVSDLYLAMDAQGDLTAFGSVDGAIDWSSGDRSGRCNIDFQFDIETSGESLTYSASGVVCNVTLDQNVTFTP